MKIALAASGGGHLRQLTDLAPFLEGEGHELFFVTEPTALARSLEGRWRVRYLDHFAYGQRKRESVRAMAMAGARNAQAALAIAREERPDVVISTGAGSTWFFMLWARLLGARFVLIETFARVEGPSLFGRLASPFSEFTLVQWPLLAKAYPKATLANPLRVVDAEDDVRRKQILVTVGATLPFDSMVEAVVALKRRGLIDHEIVAQVGEGGVRPAGCVSFETAPLEEMRRHLRESDIAVCHGGTGSLITALQAGCRVVAMPRSAARGEHYDDHQEEIVRALAGLGLVEIAQCEETLGEAIGRLVARPRRRIEMDGRAIAAPVRAHLGLGPLPVPA